MVAAAGYPSTPKIPPGMGSGVGQLPAGSGTVTVEVHGTAGA